MSPLKLLRVWLLALMVVLVGCGGHDDPIPDDLDASGDARRSDVTSDRLGDAQDGRGDAGDAPLDSTLDVRVDTPDVRIDTGVDIRVDVADVRVDTADVRIDTGIVDIRVEPLPDIRPDVADVRVDNVDVRADNDVRVDIGPDVPRDADASFDVSNDADAGCSSDNQCGGLTPHCNTNTGACVGRVAIAVTPANTSIAAGTTQQFVATMTYSDTSTGDVTALATWASSVTTVATLNPGTPGLATGVTQGTTTISAVFAGLAAGTQLTVTAAQLVSIQVTPPNPINPLGTTRQFTATGTYSDNSIQDLTASAMWASSVTSVATIAAGGLASTVALGNSVISATVGAISGNATLTVTGAVLVSINVTPANATIATLTTQDFTATGTYTDNTTQDLTTQATWASSDSTIAALNGTTATGLSAGTTTISATVGNTTGSTPLHVTGATLTSIEVTPANPTAGVGFTLQFRAIGHFDNPTTTQDLTADVLWGSSADANASISNAGGSEGLATTLQAGTSVISATLVGVTGSTTLTITTATLQSIEIQPPNPSIAKGTTQALTAIGHFSDASILNLTAQASWSSTTIGVATVSNNAGERGVATGVNTGMTTIIATVGALSGTTTLTVSPATLMSIAVTPVNPSTPASTPVQFIATGTYSDATAQDITTLVTWSSSDMTVATISSAAGSEGLATPGVAGTTTIAAALNMLTGATVLTVTP